MQERFTRLSRRTALLAIGAALAVPAVAFADDDKDDKGKKEDAANEKERSERDDRQTTGQVLEINTLKDPPEMIIANADGKVLVRCLKTDIIAQNSVRLGDYVTVTGEKISEIEFEAQDMSVDGHLGDENDNEDD
ncbi:MAG: hypothetical protein AB7P40_18250 [Chloroflexota bacterium]